MFDSDIVVVISVLDFPTTARISIHRRLKLTTEI